MTDSSGVHRLYSSVPRQGHRSPRPSARPAAGDRPPARAVDLAVYRRPASANPGWLRLVAEVHASLRSLRPAAVDLALLALVGWAVGELPPWAALPWAAGVVGVGYLTRVYDDRDSLQTRGALWYPTRVVLPLTLASLVFAAAGAVGLPRGLELVAVGLATLTGLRLLTWLVLLTARRRGVGLHRTLIVGSGRPAEVAWAKLVDFPEAGLAPVGAVSLDLLTADGGLDREIAAHRAEHVLLVPSGGEMLQAAAGLAYPSGSDAYVSMVPPLGELFLTSVRVSELGGLPLISLGRVLRARTTFPGKRAFDLVLSGALLLVLGPLFALVAAAVLFDSGRPVFFRQRRVGRDGQPFHMLKFRSMIVGADRLVDELRHRNVTDGPLFKVADDPRVTRVGRLLRRTSIDELPQLWNVLRGEMSLVGPRPLIALPAEFPSREQARHTVLPGITGYWQISGGCGLSYQEMVKLDLAYIRNWSMWLDLRLLFRTVPALLNRHGPA